MVKLWQSSFLSFTYPDFSSPLISVLSEPVREFFTTKKKAVAFSILYIFFMASDNNNFIQPAVPRFDGHYDHWSMLMENFLRSKEYWPLIEPRIEEPKDATTLTEAQKN